MNHKQYEEFQHIAQQCESGKFNSINVGSKVRSDAIVAVWNELNVRSIESRQLRRALYELVETADPETNMSMIPLLDALGQARTALKGPIIVRKGIINGESKLRSDVVVAWEERAHLYGALRELVRAADPETNMSMIPLLDALGRARAVLGDNE